MKKKRVRLSCTTSAQVGECVELLLRRGLHGNSRAAVVERLICRGIEGTLDVATMREIAERVSRTMVDA